MQSTTFIPIHSLIPKSPEIDFDLMLWGKKASRYNSNIPHKHNYNEILIFFKGGGLHEIDFEDYEIEPCSIHFVRAGMVHIVKRNVYSSGCSILFKMEYFNSLSPGADILSCLPIHPLSTNAHPVLKISSKHFIKIRNIISCIQDEYVSKSNMNNILIQTYLQLFLLECAKTYSLNNSMQEVKQKKISVSKIKLNDFFLLTEKHFKEHLSLADYAAMLNMNSNYLNEICKKELGKTASSLIHEKMIKEIKSQLCYTNDNIKSIAYNLNFKELSNFRQYFQKYTGFTPTTFRKKVL